MKSPEALIFDLDGTLWDSIDACVAAWNDVLSSRPDLAKITREQLLGSMGKNHEQICAEYFPSLPMPERSALIKKCYAREVSFFRENPPQLFANVAEGLMRLRADYRLALVSNCQREYLDFVLTHYDLKKLFSSAICYEDTKRTKGENIKQAMRELNITTAYYIGDTLSDQQAALAAECSFAYAAYGFGEVEWFDASFDSFAEVVQYFSQMVD